MVFRDYKTYVYNPQKTIDESRGEYYSSLLLAMSGRKLLVSRMTQSFLSAIMKSMKGADTRNCHKIAVPHFRQGAGHWCGPAVLRMLLTHWGIEESESRLARRARPNKHDGTPPEKVAAIASSYGLDVFVGMADSLATLTCFLKQKIPVVVCYTEPVHNESHYAIVVGITPTLVVLNDPLHGKHFKLSRSSFRRRWHDEHNRNHRWIMAASSYPLTKCV